MDRNIKMINNRALKEKIYILRGQKVMMDYDLAEIYGYTTSAFNQQVFRNIERFKGEDFMFQLNESDLIDLSISQNVISIQTKGIKGGRAKMPYVFTEQGIYMLMTVLHGELAVKQSRALIRMFKAMKDYIVENQEQIDYRNNLQLAVKVVENTQNLEKIQVEMNKIDTEILKINKELDGVIRRSEISPIILDFGKVVEQREFIFMDGEPVKASEAYIDLYSKAKNCIFIIDNYINIKTLRHLCKVEPHIKIMIFSDNLGNYLHHSDYLDFQKEYPGLKIQFIKTEGRIHDRFIVLDYETLDEKVYHAGASEKDAGKKLTMIAMLDDKIIKNALHVVIEDLKRNRKLWQD